MKVSLVLVICLFGVAQSGPDTAYWVSMLLETNSSPQSEKIEDQVQNVGQSGQMVDQRKDSLNSRSQTVGTTPEFQEDLDEVLSELRDLNFKIEYQLFKYAFEGEEESLQARKKFLTCREEIHGNVERPENYEEALLSWSTDECNFYKPEELADMLI